ncbi:MAG: hypothetical protein ACN4GF_02105, partial [Lentimonas sp.]
ICFNHHTLLAIPSQAYGSFFKELNVHTELADFLIIDLTKPLVHYFGSTSDIHPGRPWQCAFIENMTTRFMQVLGLYYTS